MFVSKIRREVVLDQDTEYEVVVTVQKLAAIDLEEAAEIRQAKAIQAMRAMGGDVVKSLNELGRERQNEDGQKPRDLKAEREARYNTYDRATILCRSIKHANGRTKQVEIPTDKKGSLDVVAFVKELDEHDTMKLHRFIVDLSAPPLDEDEERRQQGEDSGLSTGS